MDAEEIRFRLACEARKAAGRVRAHIAPRQWRRADLRSVLSAPTGGAPLLAARRALSSGDLSAAQRQLATHFTERVPHFVLDPRRLPDLVRRIRLRFPEAASDSMQRAERIVAGRYDLLGYREIPFGTTPAWHADPVHGRKAPADHWTAIRYLDPEYGDHKIIWEINRHQHWLSLARAYHLTGDSRYYRAVVEQLESWMRGNPPHRGINWASMLELGFRAISWTWALHFLAPAAAEDRDDEPWIVDLLIGIDAQLQHIEDNLSRYFSPNTHLLGEALALYVVSAALPELGASARRVTLGREVLLCELDRQVLADGGHAELSAHYHRYTTDFYLLALLSAQTNGDPAAAALEGGARKLAEYLRTLTDDHGRLPLIGDDDGGQLFPICGARPADCRDTLASAATILDEPALLVSDVPEETFWLCGDRLPLENLRWRPTPWRSTALPQSGYYVSRTPDGDHLVFDAGRHGYLNGGHAHADALSLVLTVGGHPLLVDGGTGTYTMDPSLRDRFRTTAMHNTVVVDGRSQSEPRGPFHWRTAVDARAPVWVSDTAFDYVEGNHDAYAPIAHSRSVLSVHGMGWIVIDHLLGDGNATADAFWHLHPDWIAQPDRRRVTLRHGSGAVLALASSLTVEILPPGSGDGLDTYSPVYGLMERGTCLRVRSAGPLPRTFATVVTHNPETQPGQDVEVSAMSVSDVPAGWHGAAFRIALGSREAVVLACVERRPSVTAAGPGAMWGTGTIRTDGRVALSYFNGTAAPIVVLGSCVESRAGLVRA